MRRWLTVVILIGGIATLVVHPGGRHRLRVVTRKLNGETPLARWSDVALEILPSPLRLFLRSHVASEKLLGQWIEKLDCQSDSEEPVNYHVILNGPTPVMASLDCHFTILQPGRRPHPPHVHPQEELLIPVSGDVEIVRTDPQNPALERNARIGVGQFAFHAANVAHTVQAIGREPSRYLVVKWNAHRSDPEVRSLPAGVYDFRQDLAAGAEGLQSRVLVEARTSHLSRLHIHVSRLAPGAGYPAHKDRHDVAIITFNGTVETNGHAVGSGNFLFFPAEVAHDMRNRTGEPARYLTIEFHPPTAQF